MESVHVKCVILAAGLGSRLGARYQSKPLCPLNGTPLIEWVIRSARDAGVREFVVVTGHARELLEARVRDIAAANGVTVTFAPNDQWTKGNGLSVTAARDFVGDSFVLLMSDHVFDGTILSRLVQQPLAAGEVILAVDGQIHDNPTVDLDDVTRVSVDHGRIAAIGKQLATYNAFDTGIFYCTRGLFDALDESVRLGDDSLSGGIRVLAARGLARTMDIIGGYWIDVDDEQALERAGSLAFLP